MSELALLGGPKMLNVSLPDELFHWPIITKEDEDAVLVGNGHHRTVPE